MKTQRYNLLTTLIVSALHPNEPFGAGTKWEPTNTIDIQEAEELVGLNYAEHWEARKEDVLSRTWLQKQDDAKKAAAAETDEFDPDALGNGTNADDDDLKSILDGNVDAVIAEIDGLDVDQLRRLAELEDQRDRPRKGVAEAINEAIELIESQGEHGEESEDDNEEDQE